MSVAALNRRLDGLPRTRVGLASRAVPAVHGIKAASASAAVTASSTIIRWFSFLPFEAAT